MPSPSAGDSARCSLPTPKVVEASGIFLFMPEAAHCRKNDMCAPPTSAAHDPVRRRLLDLGDGRAEVGHVEREEVGLRHGAFALLDVVRDPLRGDLAVVVVGRQHVDLVAPLLHRVVDDRLDRLRRRGAGDEAVAVADAAFVQHVVEVERVGAPEGLADGLARGRGDAAVHHVDLVLARELLRVLGVQRDVRLACRTGSSSILRPSRPPAALISSTASVVAITIGLP